MSDFSTITHLRAETRRLAEEVAELRFRISELTAEAPEVDFPGLTLRSADRVVLGVLSRRSGCTVPRYAIAQALSARYGHDVTDRTVDVHICYIRREFARVGAMYEIQTIRGVDYALHDTHPPSFSPAAPEAEPAQCAMRQPRTGDGAACAELSHRAPGASEIAPLIPGRAQ